MSSPEDDRPTPEPAPDAAPGADHSDPWNYSVPASPATDATGTDAESSAASSESGSSRATTQLPATGRSPSETGSDEKPTSTAPNWTSNETQNFPAYQPQSYPTYPPVHSPTTELPAVGAGGPAPSSAVAYTGAGTAAGGSGPAVGGGPGASGSTAGYGSYSAEAAKPARRGGAGFAGAVGLIGLCSAAAGAFALPVQQFANSQNTYFGTYRDLAAHKLTSSGANDHSISIVGGHIATEWWRYGVFGALGGLAVLLLVQICVPVLRRLAGLLLFLGGLAAIAGFLLGAHQTNDYSSVSRGQNLHRISWQHLAYGFWVAVAGCAVVALGGLIAGLQSTRK